MAELYFFPLYKKITKSLSYENIIKHCTFTILFCQQRLIDSYLLLELKDVNSDSKSPETINA